MLRKKINISLCIYMALSFNALSAFEKIKHSIGLMLPQRTTQDYTQQADQACSQIKQMQKTMAAIKPLEQFQSIHEEIDNDLKTCQKICVQREMLRIKEMKGSNPQIESLRRKGNAAFIKGFEQTNNMYSAYIRLNDAIKDDAQ